MKRRTGGQVMGLSISCESGATRHLVPAGFGGLSGIPVLQAAGKRGEVPEAQARQELQHSLRQSHPSNASSSKGRFVLSGEERGLEPTRTLMRANEESGAQGILSHGLLGGWYGLRLCSLPYDCQAGLKVITDRSPSLLRKLPDFFFF